LQEEYRERNEKQPLNSHQDDVPARFHDFDRVQATKMELRIHEHLRVSDFARKRGEQPAKNKEHDEAPKRIKASHPKPPNARQEPD
jgi:hypothetical protein